MPRSTIYSIHIPAALALAALLSGCGGGGGGGSAAAAAAPETPCRIQIVADSAVDLGKTASATVLSCAGEALPDITWTQTSGAAVDLLAARSPTVALEARSEGNIGLRASVVMADGSTVSASSAPKIAK